MNKKCISSAVPLKHAHTYCYHFYTKQHKFSTLPPNTKEPLTANVICSEIASKVRTHKLTQIHTLSLAKGSAHKYECHKYEFQNAWKELTLNLVRHTLSAQDMLHYEYHELWTKE